MSSKCPSPLSCQKTGTFRGLKFELVTESSQRNLGRRAVFHRGHTLDFRCQHDLLLLRHARARARARHRNASWLRRSHRRATHLRSTRGPSHQGGLRVSPLNVCGLRRVRATLKTNRSRKFLLGRAVGVPTSPSLSMGRTTPRRSRRVLHWLSQMTFNGLSPVIPTLRSFNSVRYWGL